MPGSGVPVAPRVGADLRAARERLGWSLPDTSAYVRIRLPFLQALEDGRMEDLPGPVYAVGFVRSYSIALGLDPEEMVRRHREEAGTPPPRAKLNFPTPLPQRHVPAGTVVMLGGLLAVGAYVGWYRASGDRPVAVSVQQVPARLAPLALPLVPPAPVHVAAATPVAPAATAYVPSSVPPSAAEAAIPSPGALTPVVPDPGVPAAATRLVLGATADAWVQVKDGQGKIVFSKLMHQGDSWAVPDQGAMLLTTGNAGGTTLTLDGKALPSLGTDGAVRRDVPIDLAALGGHA